MVAAACPRCASVVALHEGRPFVTTNGTVELWHAVCWSNRDVPVVVESISMPVVLPVRVRRSRLPIAGAVAASAVLALVIGSHALAHDVPQASQVNADCPVTEPTSMRASNATHEVLPPKPVAMTRLEDAHPIPVDDHDKPIDDVFPSLRSWVHPITAAAELYPDNPARHFGAHRAGVERAECGEGHCGIDLDGPFGRPLVAVAAGVLITVERRELGADGRSGRYVRIQHEDGTLTSYMHMDEIDEQLQPGDHVKTGQYLGTLGDSAVPNAPHLHFSLELPRRPGSRDVIFSETRFVDPAPFLVRAMVVESAERRHPIKPAF